MKINKGLIVSIQRYTQHTNNELAKICELAGAVAIRTDQPDYMHLLPREIPTIGVKKLPDKSYYITTTIEAINDVAKWAQYIAIDSRKGNRDLTFLYSYCHIHGLKIVADIEKIKDYENIIDICMKNNIEFPVSIATTFSKGDTELIAEIKKLKPIHVIAEGAYSDKYQILNAIKNGADNICIGAAISDIGLLTQKYINMIRTVNNVLDSTAKSSK